MSSLKRAIEKLIADTHKTLQASTGGNPPEAGVVTAINTDGTVEVQTKSSLFHGVGNPSPNITKGAQVLVITSLEGTKTVIPQ